MDRHKLLKWMVEKLEMLKTSNEAAQYLYLQLVIKVSFLIGRFIVGGAAAGLPVLYF